MITVLDYAAGWPERFGKLREEYDRAMSDSGVPVVAIEHVGSTAVPGLAAKQVIDCDIVVRPEHVAAASEVLVRIGFTPQGELGIPLTLGLQGTRAPGRDGDLRDRRRIAGTAEPSGCPRHPAIGPSAA